VNGYIAQPPGGAQFIVDKCFGGVAAACSLITFADDQSITEIRNVALNLDRIVTDGLDIEAEYRVPLGQGENALLLRGLATYVGKLKTVSFGDSVDRAGQTGMTVGLAAPRWTVNGYITYASPRVTLTVQGRYIAPGQYDAQRIGPDDPGYATTLPNSISDNRVAGRFYVNLFGSVHVGPDRDKGFELFGSINNLFNRAPPPAPETAFYTNPVYFDTIGRYFRAGARVKF
jgi:hypothetical protein